MQWVLPALHASVQTSMLFTATMPPIGGAALVTSVMAAPRTSIPPTNPIRARVFKHGLLWLCANHSSRGFSVVQRAQDKPRGVPHVRVLVGPYHALNRLPDLG